MPLTITQMAHHTRFEQHDEAPARLKITTLDVRRVRSESRDEAQIEIAIDTTKNNRTYTCMSSFLIPADQLDAFIQALTEETPCR